MNNENLLQVIGLVLRHISNIFLIIFSSSSNNLIVCCIIKAKEAWDVVESFRSTDLPAFADMIKTIVPMIDGSKSLSNRITALEMQLSNGTAMALPNKGVRYYLYFPKLLYSVMKIIL